jgi:hypothetical protein
VFTIPPPVVLAKLLHQSFFPRLLRSCASPGSEISMYQIGRISQLLYRAASQSARVLVTPYDRRHHCSRTPNALAVVPSDCSHLLDLRRSAASCSADRFQNSSHFQNLVAESCHSTVRLVLMSRLDMLPIALKSICIIPAMNGL